MEDLTKDDVKRYAAENTDFGFEMKVVRAFRYFEWEVEHTGTYVDPVSKKNREFDLRATNQFKKWPYSVYLAAECKNISPSCPLIVQAVQRTPRESFHEIIHFSMNGSQPQTARSTVFSRYASAESDWVGKSFDQVRLDKKKDELISSEGKTFDKMSQALNSAEGLIQKCAALGKNYDTRFIILPVLVIPDKCLWRLRYNEGGEPIGEPEQVESIQYFINQSWPFDAQGMGGNYTMSHLEIVTISAIGKLVKGLITDDDPRSAFLFRIKGD
jgi:hypothetical protein